MIATSSRSARVLASPAPVRLGRELDERRVEAGLLEHRPRRVDGDRERQHGARVRLDDHRVARDERGEDPGVGVPRREGVAPDDEGDAARDDPVVLLHPDRSGVALAVLAGLLPHDRLGHPLLLDEPGGDGLDRPLLRVRPARLERHDEGLPRRVHDRVGHLERPLVDLVDDLDAHRGAHLRTGVTPRRHRRPAAARPRSRSNDG